MSRKVLVECVASYRMRYLVEVKDGDPNAYALDVVTCEDAKEFSQEFLGESIISERTISDEEAVEIFKKDVDYLDHLEYDKIMDIVLTTNYGENQS